MNCVILIESKDLCALYDLSFLGVLFCGVHEAAGEGMNVLHYVV